MTISGPAPRLWLLRHAPVLGGEGRCYGQSDLHPSTSADEAARLVRERFEALGAGQMDEIWSSPLSRARELAEALGRAWNVPVHVEARITEVSFGAWEGRLWSELERDDRERFFAWMDDWKRQRPPGGESWADLVARVASWLADLDPRVGPRLVVSHAGTMRAMRVRLEGITPEAAFAERVEHLRPYPLGG